MSLQADRQRGRRWWTRRTAFLRSVGLELPFILRLGEDAEEKPKVIIKTSRKLAVVRCSIHVIPILVSITVLILNIGNSYLGRGLPGSIIDPAINIALLQIAAKIQELLMVGSMTTIVMHVLRSELLSGEGLPLGLIGGGFLYSSMSYFWSPEFWASTSTRHTIKSKLRVFGVLLLGGVIALFAGPSTAVLLVPRDQKWLAGGTTTYVAASSHDWWPTTLIADSVARTDSCRSPQAIYDATCPSGGFLNMLSAASAIDILGTSTYAETGVKNLTSGFTFGPRTLDVSSNVDILPSMRYHGNFRGYACETSISGPRLANAAYQVQLKDDWIQEAFAIPYNILRYGPSLSQYKYFGSMQVGTETQIPAVRSVCSPLQLLNPTQGSVLFPVLSADRCSNTVAELASADIVGLNQQTSNTTKALWAQLPPHFGTVSGGLILELPSSVPSEQADVRAIIACSFDARWAPGHVITYHLEPASSLERVAAQIVSTTSRLSNSVPASGWLPGYSEFSSVRSDTHSSQVLTNTSWLESLTPELPEKELNGLNPGTTTLERLVHEVGLVNSLNNSIEDHLRQWGADTVGRVNKTVALEWWLSLILTDGMSRTGSSQVIGMDSETSQWSLLHYRRLAQFSDNLFAGKEALARPDSDDVVEERVRVTIEGYSYQATSISDYASAALLLVHILAAMLHTCYSVWTQRSSTSWDSLTELLVLVHNSRPSTTALKNTGAGINELRTFSKCAKIFVKQNADGPKLDTAVETVELVFEDDQRYAVMSKHPHQTRALASAIEEHRPDIVPIETTFPMRDLTNVHGTIRESHTFPISSRDAKRNYTQSHHYSESTDQLIPPSEQHLTAVQSDRYYG